MELEGQVAIILRAGTLVHFSQGRLERIEMPPTSGPLAISGNDLPPGTVVR
jgi:hypothetical protein